MIYTGNLLSNKHVVYGSLFVRLYIDTEESYPLYVWITLIVVEFLKQTLRNYNFQPNITT